MSLRPPTDYSRPLLCAVIGVSLAVICATFKASYLPSVGDNLHSLPHGGSYRDGTKAINYNGLNCVGGASVNSQFLPSKIVAFSFVCVISLLVYACSRPTHRPISVQHYCVHHRSI
uniref:Movement protein TGB2 n=1 Tax=Cherry necrotic rusty mottle virus TaxID=129143 RepID=A0A0S2SVR5_9VIRU|nr:triple gene block protein 2 [Cherry necrotic rusty mottle virus]